MTDTYKPNGIPLTDREREILIVLMEECAEVVQAASKLLRFGKENRPDNEISNVETLAKEIGDLRYMLTMTRDAGLSKEEIEIHQQAVKQLRMRYFMQSKV